MKKYTFLFVGTLLISLFSCQEKNDHNYVETKTNLDIDIPIVEANTDGTKSNLNNSSIDYSFTGEGSYASSSFLNSENEIYNIQNIRPDIGSEMIFSGINTNDEIYSLVLEWGYKTPVNEDYVMQVPVNLMLFDQSFTEGNFVVNMDEVLLKIMNKKVETAYSFKFKIKGSSNFVINGIAKWRVPVILRSEVLTTHFELF